MVNEVGFMKRFFCSAFLLILFCLAAYPTQAAEKGQIYGWGHKKLPNEPLTNILKIASGGLYNLALKSDGSIVGWGWNYFGEARPPEVPR